MLITQQCLNCRYKFRLPEKSPVNVALESVKRDMDISLLLRGYERLRMYKRSKRYTANFSRIRKYLRKHQGFVSLAQLNAAFSDIEECERVFIYNRDFNPIYISGQDEFYVISPEHYKYNKKHNEMFSETEFIRILVQGYDEWELAYKEYYGGDSKVMIPLDMTEFLKYLVTLEIRELSVDKNTEIVHSSDESDSADGSESSNSDSDSSSYGSLELNIGLENLQIEIQTQLTRRNRHR